MPDSFYLNLTLAILYRARLDQSSRMRLMREDADAYLRSDFARWAGEVLADNQQALTFSRPAVAEMTKHLNGERRHVRNA